MHGYSALSNGIINGGCENEKYENEKVDVYKRQSVFFLYTFRIVDRIYCRDSFDYDAFICRREKE